MGIKFSLFLSLPPLLNSFSFLPTFKNVPHCHSRGHRSPSFEFLEKNEALFFDVSRLSSKSACLYKLKYGKGRGKGEEMPNETREILARTRGPYNFTPNR